MRDWFYALTVASVVGAACTLLAGSRFEKHMRTVVSLCCILMLVLPLKSLIPVSGGGLPQFEEYSLPPGTGAEELVRDETQRLAERAVCDAVFAEFGIKPVRVRIEIDWDAETPSVAGVTVSMPPGGDGAAVKDFLSIRLGGKIDVCEE